MSKKFKSQASSARAANSTFGSPAFGFGNSGFQPSSSLSYVAEQPGLSGVSDPHVVVSLRNLGKKDSTTKAKALEELQDYVTAIGSDFEESVLNAWIALYPRTSIDNSRRVRQLAHTLQGSVTSSTRKRIASHLPKAVGPWLCGLYDNDRAVSRAAQDALSTCFSSEEKRMSLWVVYKQPLLEYAEDAITIQTSATLSDERSTSKDDAESKHARVVGSAIYMLGQLIQNIQQEKKPPPAAFTEKLELVLASKKLWEYVHNSDPYLRRSACSLARLCADNGLDMDWTVISTAFASKGLQTSQLGSNNQFVGALLTLTRTRPDIWTNDYHGKTASSKRLMEFLKRGSQRGPEEVWRYLQSLLEVIPPQVFASAEGNLSAADAVAVAKSLKEGVMHADEPRQNLAVAWSCYVEICFKFQSRLAQAADQETFYHESLAPIVSQYVEPADGLPTLPANVVRSIVKTALFALESNMTTAFSKLWSDLGIIIENKMKLSLPETSKSFDSSQEGLLKVADRLFRLAQAVLEGVSSSASKPELDLPFAKLGLTSINQFTRHVINAAIGVLKNRNGKPYGAAYVLQAAASMSNAADAAGELLKPFLTDDAHQLMQSPSAERLVKLTASLRLQLSPLLRSLIASSELNSYGEKAFAAILSTISEEEAATFPEMGLLVVNILNGESSDSTSILFASSILLNPNLNQGDVIRHLTQAVLDYLDPSCAPRKQHGALVLLQAALSDSASAAIFNSNEYRSQLLSKLLVLSDKPDHETSELATDVLTKLKVHSTRTGTGQSATATVIAEQLLGTKSQLPILSLVDLAIGEFDAAEEKGQISRSLLPSPSSWSSALEPHTRNRPPSSFSITSPLQGAVYTVNRVEDHTKSAVYDSEGLSEAFRLTLYVTRLMSETKIADVLDEARSRCLYQNLPFALQLINDKVTMDSANALWIEGTGEVIDEAANVLLQGNAIIDGWVDEDSAALATVMQERWEKVQGVTPDSYYSALVVHVIAARMFDRGGLLNIFPNLESDVKQLHKSDEMLRVAALAASARDTIISTASGRRTLNELISNATEVKETSARSLVSIVLLNIILTGDSELLEGIQSQRLVFLMQNLVRLLESATVRLEATSEIFKLLSVVLPTVGEIYGEQWQHILNHIAEVWESTEDLEASLPLIHSSLRLYQKLRAMSSSDEVNEDLIDAWAASKSRLDAGLVQCLWSFNKPSIGVNGPRQITAELLGRMLGSTEIQAEKISVTIPLMAAQDDSVVRAAYSLLHRAIPKRQEDLSLELALEKQRIHLPDELLAIIADQEGQPLHTSTRYLLCWSLVFDHFPNASYKLREAYSADLKEAGQLPALLDSICETIRITSGRPLDASKLGIEGYIVGSDSSEAAGLQNLSVHIYYSCLLHVPGLVKTWYIEQKNRTRSPLESWTQKYISPAIVAASLKAAAEWARTQGADDNPVEVKTNSRSRELIASLAIDPESPPISIAIVLPASYPLDSPTVTGRTRVGVSEKNWQAWTRTFQIIIFSTGSIIEGLIAFRRNVQGALKGHGECAICYSIIGTDMQTPNKKCGTCKNQFHGVCLFRWFKSSNSSSCPLCRNNFNYA